MRIITTMSRLLKGLLIGGALSSAVGLRVFRDRQLMKDPNNFKHVWFKTPGMTDLALKTNPWNLIYVPNYYHSLELVVGGETFDSIHVLRKTTDDLIMRDASSNKENMCQLFRVIANNFNALSAQTDKSELIRNLSHIAYRDGYISDISEYATEKTLLVIFSDYNSAKRTDIIKSYLSYVPKKAITQQIHDACAGIAFTAKEYNQYFGHIEKFKVLNADKNHNGFQYQKGLNIDTNEFNPNTSCYDGLYYTTKPDDWRNYFECDSRTCCIGKVTIPDSDTNLVKIESHNKCKTKQFVLSKIKKY